MTHRQFKKLLAPDKFKVSRRVDYTEESTSRLGWTRSERADKVHVLLWNDGEAQLWKYTADNSALTTRAYDQEAIAKGALVTTGINAFVEYPGTLPNVILEKL